MELSHILQIDIKEANIRFQKKWLNEHKEQMQEHISDGLSIEDLDDDWEKKPMEKSIKAVIVSAFSAESGISPIYHNFY